MYARDGRMLVLITHNGRPKPSRTDMTDQDRADQYRTLNTYGGTYTFHGNSVEHQSSFRAIPDFDEALRSGKPICFRDFTFRIGPSNASS